MQICAGDSSSSGENGGKQDPINGSEVLLESLPDNQNPYTSCLLLDALKLLVI